MSIVIDAGTGAQLLPDIRDPRAPVSSWVAYQACSADNRRKFTMVGRRAEQFVIVGQP